MLPARCSQNDSEEQRDQGDAEGVRIELQQQAAAVDWPGASGSSALVRRSFVLGVVLVGLLGLRRALLEQEHGQQDVGRHLEELALPVLEHRRDEVAAGQVIQKADRGQTMQAEFLGIGPPACQCLANEGDQEQGKQRETAIVTQEPTHTTTLTLVNCYGWLTRRRSCRVLRPAAFSLLLTSSEGFTLHSSVLLAQSDWHLDSLGHNTAPDVKFFLEHQMLLDHQDFLHYWDDRTSP